MTLDGLGIGAIPPRIVTKELASGALIKVQGSLIRPPTKTPDPVV
jgi:hypothetical protein